MNANSQSTGNPAVISSTAETGNDTSIVSAPSRAPRDGRITLAALVDDYMAQYAGRDPSRPQRLAWWVGKLGHVPLGDLTDDLIADALDDLAVQRGRYWAGIDADGKAIYRAKKGTFSGAGVNRYTGREKPAYRRVFQPKKGRLAGRDHVTEVCFRFNYRSADLTPLPRKTSTQNDFTCESQGHRKTNQH